MISYKRKLNYINELIYAYELYNEKNILCNDLFVCTLRLILFSSSENQIKEYYFNFMKLCFYRYKKKEEENVYKK